MLLALDALCLFLHEILSPDGIIKDITLQQAINKLELLSYKGFELQENDQLTFRFEEIWPILNHFLSWDDMEAEEMMNTNARPAYLDTWNLDTKQFCV